MGSLADDSFAPAAGSAVLGPEGVRAADARTEPISDCDGDERIDEEWTLREKVSLADKLAGHLNFPATLSKQDALTVLHELAKDPTKSALVKIRTLCDRVLDSHERGTADDQDDDHKHSQDASGSKKGERLLLSALIARG